MGVRGELFSTKVLLQNRTYFFNVKENRLGDLYLNIVESKNRDEGGFDRQSVILFAEDLQEFLRGFDESLRVLEKAAREKRRDPGNPGRDKNASERPGGRDKAASDEEHSGSRRDRYSGNTGAREPGGRRFKARDKQGKGAPPRRDESSGRDRQGHRDSGETAPRKKRVVVRKK